MAANSNRRGLVSFGKRFVNQIRSGGASNPTQCPSLSLRRAVHSSAYDKNPDDQVDDQVHPTVVPDEVIQPQSDKYWAPHPQTGVFGPASEHNPAAGGERGLHSSPVNAGEDSVLEQKAFFRPLEDLEKPPDP